jgi:hypothetical protein
VRGQGHDPPVTVLADDALPVLAEPVDSDEELLLDADGVVVVVDVVVMNAVVPEVVEVPAVV